MSQSEDKTQSYSMTASQAAKIIRNINLGLEHNIDILFNIASILKYINAPLKSSSNSYPNIVKVSGDLLNISNTLDIFDDCDLKNLPDTCKKLLIASLHPVIKLYDGLY